MGRSERVLAESVKHEAGPTRLVMKRIFTIDTLARANGFSSTRCIFRGRVGLLLILPSFGSMGLQVRENPYYVPTLSKT